MGIVVLIEYDMVCDLCSVLLFSIVILFYHGVLFIQEGSGAEHYSFSVN